MVGWLPKGVESPSRLRHALVEASAGVARMRAGSGVLDRLIFVASLPAFLLLAACTREGGGTSPSSTGSDQPASDLRALTPAEEAVVLALIAEPASAPPAPAPDEPAQVTLARIRAVSADGVDAPDAAWIGGLVRAADPGSTSGRLVAANAIAALAGDPGEPARSTLRGLLAIGEAPVRELFRSLIVELLASESDEAAREILRAAQSDPAAIVRAKADRALTLAE